MDAWNALRSSPTPISQSYPGFSSSSAAPKRKPPPEYADPFAPMPPKRRQSGGDIIPGTQRVIQPKPSSNGQSPLLVPSPQPTQPKKRGRPSKAEVEARNADLVAKGKIIPTAKPASLRSKPPELAPREPEPMAHREPIMFPAQPPRALLSAGVAESPLPQSSVPFESQQIRGGATESDVSDTATKKKRRLGPSVFQKDQNPSESGSGIAAGGHLQFQGSSPQPPVGQPQPQLLASRPVAQGEPNTAHTPSPHTAPEISHPKGTEAKGTETKETEVEEPAGRQRSGT